MELEMEDDHNRKQDVESKAKVKEKRQRFEGPASRQEDAAKEEDAAAKEGDPESPDELTGGMAHTVKFTIPKTAVKVVCGKLNATAGYIVKRTVCTSFKVVWSDERIHCVRL